MKENTQKQGEMNCPLCGKELEKEIHFCYHCGRFLNETNTQEQKIEDVTEDSIKELVSKSEENMRIYQNNPAVVKTRRIQIFMIIFIFLSIIPALMGYVPVAIGIFIIGFISVFVADDVIKKPQQPQQLTIYRFASLIWRYVMPDVMKQYFSKVNYCKPNQMISADLIKKSKLIKESYNAESGGQHFMAEYQGIPMEFSNVHLKYVTEDDENNKQEKEVFKGIWLACDLGIKLETPLRIQEKNLLKIFSASYKTGNLEFDDHYMVRCKNRSDAERFLTPAMANAINEMRGFAQGEVSVFVMENGWACFSIENGRKLLETKDVREPLQEIRNRMSDDFQYIISMLEMLRRAL